MLNNIKVPTRQPKSKKGYIAAREHWLKHVLADRNLSPRAKIAASTMCLYFNQEEFAREGRLWAWPSLRTLDRATGQSKVTVIAAIEELKAAGYLEVRRRYDPVARRYKSHRYLAAIPEGDGSKPGKFSDPILNQGGSDGYTRVVQTGSTDSSTYSKNDSYAAGSLACADARRSPAHSQQVFYAAFGSPELEAWDAYGRAKGTTYPRDKRGGWTFPTQWPPPRAPRLPK